MHGCGFGTIAMCLDAAENPMMHVPWWVNIGCICYMRCDAIIVISATIEVSIYVSEVEKLLKLISYQVANYSGVVG